PLLCPIELRGWSITSLEVAPWIRAPSSCLTSRPLTALDKKKDAFPKFDASPPAQPIVNQLGAMNVTECPTGLGPAAGRAARSGAGYGRVVQPRPAEPGVSRPATSIAPPVHTLLFGTITDSTPIAVLKVGSSDCCCANGTGVGLCLPLPRSDVDSCTRKKSQT